jgi:hypothetical protein
MIFRIYNVIDLKTKKIVKIGSTIQSLKQRANRYPYNAPSYKNYTLELRREFTYEDRDFGILLL